MTTTELKNEVIALAFDNSIIRDGDYVRFNSAANKSLYEINGIRPTISEYKLQHYPIPNMLSIGFDTIYRNEFIADVGTGKCMYFLYKGTGTIYTTGTSTFVDAVATTLTPSYRKFETVKHILPTGTKKVKITGSIDIIHIAIYDYAVSETADIPEFEEYVDYDLTELISNYSSFLALSKNGEELCNGIDFKRSSYLLSLPRSPEGTYSVRYRCRPARIDILNKPNENVDLSPDLAELLPIRTAAYLLLDDEPDKANHYYNLYYQMEQSIRNRELHPLGTIKSANNW